jgi:hypothetical protein
MLAAFAITAQANDVRWHIYPDESVLLDDDIHGERLILPEDYHLAQGLAESYYGEINPDSFTKIGKGYCISFDIAPVRILGQNELANWAQANSAAWWQGDLLTVIYRNLEREATANAAEDPEREQTELMQKKETASIRDPPQQLVRDLASHNVRYTQKATTYDGDNTWRFEIRDPQSSRMVNIPVPVGASEKAILQTIYNACLSDSNTWVNGKRSISPMSKEMLSWVHW